MNALMDIPCKPVGLMESMVHFLLSVLRATRQQTLEMYLDHREAGVFLLGDFKL